MAREDNSATPLVGGVAAPPTGPDHQKVCGIVMPISAIADDYSEEHWRRVRKILQRAIERAGMRPQLVWDNPEVDVIQSAILQNIYENDIVVCDLSGLNSNVMLETGLRLSTKKPTILVTDKIKKPPFDISTIGYIEYQRDLEYNAIEDFIERLSKKIVSLSDAAHNNTYKSFVEQFTFETVTPVTVNVSSDEFFKDRLNYLSAAIARIERAQRGVTRPRATDRIRQPTETSFAKTVSFAIISAETTAEVASLVEMEIDEIRGVVCFVGRDEAPIFYFDIHMMREDDQDRPPPFREIERVFRKHGLDYEISVLKQ